jgi:hypothetical protein
MAPAFTVPPADAQRLSHADIHLRGVLLLEAA